MKTIRDLMPAEKLDRPIEEVIKLDQQEEETVRRELEEYVLTERIQKDFEKFLREYGDGLTNPDERIGVWVSGFFGSGKSSFAKNLGYILQNRPLGGVNASDLFIERLEDARGPAQAATVRDLLGYVNARVPTRVIMFDVRLLASAGSEPVHQLMYAKLLEDLDYASDPDIAELEIELEGEGRLAEFVQICAAQFGGDARKPNEPHPVPATLSGVSQADYDVWVMVRKGAQAFQRIVSVLRELQPDLYSDGDSAVAMLRGRAQVNIDTLVDRTFDLAKRRAPGQAIVFVIDEVGSYVALSVNKIEDLRKVVEHFGQESANRVRKKQAVAPVWVIVTSQERLDEVVQAIDDKRVELARLQDRFSLRIDMSPTDIREVASLRVLAKTKHGEEALRGVYKEFESQVKTHTRLNRQSGRDEIGQDEFVQFYPYLPHFIDLSIDIVSGLRNQSGAFRQLGGSNRTIIKQAHEMLVSERTDLQHAAVGELVTLDRIYDLVEGNLNNDQKSDIGTIERQYGDNVWVARTAKAIALLEYVRNIPRTAENIAALLYRKLGDAPVLPEVNEALELLSAAEFIRQTDTGWKLLSKQEKDWSTKRNSYSPTPREQKVVLEEMLRTVFSDKALARYRFNELRTFQVDVRWDDRVIIDGREQIPLALVVCDDVGEIDERISALKPGTREGGTDFNRVFWLFASNPELDEAVTEVYRSRRMVSEHEGLRSQGSLSAEETKSLSAEKTSVLKHEEALRRLLQGAIENGRALFRGIDKPGVELGKNLSAILNALFAWAVPELYPKLKLGAHVLPNKGREAEEILKAGNLQDLSKVFYRPPDGLDLIVKDDKAGKYVVNMNAPIIQEIKHFIDGEHAYGNKVTGKSLEAKFGGIGYGWEQEILWLAMATLLRSGTIEVTYQGTRYRYHLDPQVRAAFTGTNGFRSASFAPRRAPDLSVLVNAARRFEDLTGDEVDIEESAIAHAFQRLARNYLDNLLPLEARVHAQGVDQITLVRETLQDFRSSLETILNSASDDAVNILVGEGQSFKALRERVDAIWQALDDEGLAHLDRVRKAVRRIAPMLAEEGADGDVHAAAELLDSALTSGDYFDPAHRRDINDALAFIETAYTNAFLGRHSERQSTVNEAMQQIRSMPEWSQALDGTQDEQAAQALADELLSPLAKRGDLDVQLPDKIEFDETLPSLAKMASDIAAVASLRVGIAERVQKLAAPDDKIVRVQVGAVDGLNTRLRSQQDVDAFVAQLQDYLSDVLNAQDPGTPFVIIVE